MAADGQIIIDTQIDTSGLVKGTDELEAACKRAAASVSNIGDKARNSVQKSVNALTKQNQAYRAQEKKVEDIKKQLSESTGKTVVTDEYKSLNDELTGLNNKLAQLDEKKRKFVSTGGDEGSKTFRNMEYDADRLIEQIDRVKAKMDGLKASGGAYTAADTSGLQSSLAKEQQKLAEMGDRLSTSYSDFAQKVNKYGASASSAAGNTSKLSVAVNTLKRALTSVLSGLKKVASVIGSALKKALSAVVSLAKKAGAALHGLGNSSNRAGNSLKNGIKTMLKYGLGIRSLYVLVNKLRSAFVTGMGNLAQYSRSANSAISSMQGAIARLQNSIAAAFSPILATVAPVVTQLINLLADAISYIGAFFAALSGKSTYTKALAVQKNYAASLGNTAGAASDAAAAMKDYLSGLDEVRKFEDSSSGGGGGGGGSGGGGSSGVAFEEAAIPGIVADWAEKFKEAWKNADFTEIGTTVGTKLKNALENIPWGDIQTTCNKIAQSVATFINGFVATPGLWETVGKTIGNGINTAVGMYNTFMDTVNFVKIGKAIATTLNNAITTTDWIGVGRAITQKLKAAIETLFGFVTTLNWTDLGTAIGNMINGAISNIPAGRFGTAVANLINGIFSLITSTASTISWSGLSGKIVTFLNNALHGLDWTKIGDAVGTVISDLLVWFVDTVTGVDWATFGKGVGQMLNSALLKIDDKDLSDAVIAIAIALTDALVAAVKEVDWLYVSASLFDIFNSLIASVINNIPGIEWSPFDYSEGYLEDKAKRAGEATADSYISGMSTGSGGGTLDGKLGTIVANSTHQFDAMPPAISSKSKEAHDGALSEWQTTSADYGAVSDKAAAAFDSFKNSVPKASKEAYEKSKSEWGVAQTDYSQISKNASSGFDGFSKNVSKSFKNAYKDSKSTWKDSQSDFSKTSAKVSSAFKKLPSDTQNYFSKAYASAKNAWSGSNAAFSTIANGCASAFNAMPNAISNAFKKALTAAKNAWSGASGAFRSISTNVISGFSGLEAGVKIKFTSAYTAAKAAWGSAKSDFSGIASGIVNAFSSVSNKLVSNFTTAISGIKNLGWYSAGSSAAQSVVNGMYSVSPSKWCSWFIGKINLHGGDTGYYLTVGIINGMYTTAGLGKWANWFISKVKQSLGIHSPSKLFRDEVGYYLGAGINVGLEDSTSAILKTVSGMADKIADKFQDGLSAVTLPALTASSIFPNVTLRTPVMATGAVIPPKATYSSAGSGRVSDVLEQLKGLLDKLDRPNGGTAAAGGVIHNVVQINRRTIYEEMKKEEDLVRSQSGR